MRLYPGWTARDNYAKHKKKARKRDCGGSGGFREGGRDAGGGGNGGNGGGSAVRSRQEFYERVECTFWWGMSLALIGVAVRQRERLRLSFLTGFYHDVVRCPAAAADCVKIALSFGVCRNFYLGAATGLLDALHLISHTLVCLSYYAYVHHSIPCQPRPECVCQPPGPSSTWPPCLCSTPACSSLLSVQMEKDHGMRFAHVV